MSLKKSKNKTLVAIFAHPDDEAFGPAGTLAKFAETHDVYILCATKGEAGKSQLSTDNLHDIRKKETEQSAKILGVKKVFFLGYIDGELNNNLYHKLAGKIEKRLKELKPEIIITFEPKGVSGHIDHIVVSLVTTYVFNKLKPVKKLLYYCIAQRERKYLKDYYIYFPQGYKKEEIDEVVDIVPYWDKKLKAILAHKSQKHDADKILKILKKIPKEEYFLVYKDR